MLNFSPKNRLLVLLVILFVFVNIRTVWAFGIGENIDCKAIGLISPSRAIKCIFAEYGITEEMVKENTAYLDVANYKYPYPQVTLTFSPPNPKPGEKVTASAMTSNFGNPLSDSLYFTWYLQKEDCPLNPPLKKFSEIAADPEEDPDDWDKFDRDRYRKGKKEPDGRVFDDLCNLNGDYQHYPNEDPSGIVNIEDYKIKAMRIYAGNDFEADDNTYERDSDSDGYDAILGGTDQKGKKEEHCFFHDVKAGKDYEFDECFHLFPNYSTGDGERTGDGEFEKDEEEFWGTNPADSDTAQTGHPDEANVAGLGAKDFSWTYQEGDKIGVAVEGISSGSTLFKDATYKIMWAIPGGTCEVLDEPDIFLDEDLLGEGEDYATQLDPDKWPDCPDGCEFTRILVKQKPVSSQQAPLSSYSIGSSQYFVKTETINLPSRRRVEGEGESTAESTTETVTAPDGTVTTTSDNSAGTTLEVGTTTLNHDLPDAGDYQSELTCNKIDTDSLVSSGFFTREEVDSNEKYRIALSDNQSCCDPGMNKGVDNLGNDDPVSPTPEQLEDNTALCTIASSKIEIVNSDEINTDSIFTLNKNKFNKLCLSKNLVSPTGAGEDEKIDVSLSYSPANPVNDTSDEGDNADWISVASTIENATKNESLNYTWSVSAGQSADPDATWKILPKSFLTPLGIEQTTGAGLPNLKFKANFTEKTPDGASLTSKKIPKYLKVKLNVKERIISGTGDGTRKGHAEVIIPLSSFDNKLTIKRASVSDTLVLSPETEICKIKAAVNPNTLVDAAICQVAPDEIVAVEANINRAAGETWDDYDFLWTLNGQPLSYKYIANDSDSNRLDNYSDEDFKPGKLIYFPVLAAKDSSLNLNLTVTNQKTGQKISLTKAFLVSEPTFKIISTDESTSKPKTLGHYVDLDGKEWPDYSQTEFLALANSNIKLALAPFAAFPFPDTEDLPIKWYWNDTELSSTGYSLPTFSTTDLDSSFSLKAEGIYTQDNNTKKALRDYWDVALDEYHEQLLSQTLDFTLAASIDGSTTGQKGRGKILASFISSVPAYFAFLFRLVMTAFVLLFTIWILFALFPQTQKNE